MNTSSGTWVNADSPIAGTPIQPLVPSPPDYAEIYVRVEAFKLALEFKKAISYEEDGLDFVINTAEIIENYLLQTD